MKEKDETYQVSAMDLFYAKDDELAKYAADPNCSNAQECQDLLEDRRRRAAEAEAAEEARRAAEEIRRAKIRAELQDNPFDPRNEVSADAKHIASRIVKHLWIIFIVLPLAFGFLYLILSAMISASK